MSNLRITVWILLVCALSVACAILMCSPRPTIDASHRGGSDPVRLAAADEKGDIESAQEIYATSDDWVSELRKPREQVVLRAGTGRGREFRIATYGPLGPIAKQSSRDDLLSAIDSFTRSLTERVLGIREAADLERNLLVRKAQLRMLEADEYITVDPGRGMELWPCSNDEYTVLFCYKKTRGKAVEIVYLLNHTDYPELLAANRRLHDARFVAGEVAAAAFNELPYDVRRAALAQFAKGSRSVQHAAAREHLREADRGAGIEIDRRRAVVRAAHPTDPTRK